MAYSRAYSQLESLPKASSERRVNGSRPSLSSRCRLDGDASLRAQSGVVMPAAAPQKPPALRNLAIPLAVVGIIAASALVFKNTLDKRSKDAREHARRKDYPNPI